MIKPARPGKQRSDRRGIALLEIAITIVLGTVVTTFIMISMKRQLDTGRLNRTCIEMRAILDGATAYYSSYGIWPVNIDSEAAFLSATLLTNAWGYQYHFDHHDERAWVETDVPKGVLEASDSERFIYINSQMNTDQIRMSVPVSFGQTARLIYENH